MAPRLPLPLAGRRPPERRASETCLPPGGRCPTWIGERPSREGRPVFFHRRETVAQPTPLMPHATASWLVDNTSLSFEQIAEFCGLHILEVQAMADDLASSKYTGRDPIHSGELTHAEIERGQADPAYRLQMQRGAALHAGLQAAGQARRHCLDPAQPRGDFRRPDRQADRHHAQHDQRDPRSHALEHPEHPAQGSGHPRPVLAARARRGGRPRGQTRGAGGRRGGTGPGRQA